MPLSLKPIQFIIQQCNKFLTSNISDVSSSFVLSFVLPFPWIICPLVFAIENWFVLPDPYRFDCLSHRSVSRAFSNNFQSYWWIDVPVGFSDMLVENWLSPSAVAFALQQFHVLPESFPVTSWCFSSVVRNISLQYYWMDWSVKHIAIYSYFVCFLGVFGCYRVLLDVFWMFLGVFVCFLGVFKVFLMFLGVFRSFRVFSGVFWVFSCVFRVFPCVFGCFQVFK